jgi:hypothetical protein
MATVTRNRTYGKIDQHSKMYLPCNFEVNLITHLGVIAMLNMFAVSTYHLSLLVFEIKDEK